MLTTWDALDAILEKERHGVYEVVRITDGRPVFLAEHYRRMISSLASVGADPVLPYDDFARELMRVACANGILNQNIRIEQYREYHDTVERINIYPIPSHYPTDEMFRVGVRVGLMSAERDNPQAKVFNKELRRRADRMIAETGVEEVLLVNRNGEITEGSRSNVFFIKGDTVIAAPQHTVLPGITRLKVLDIIREQGISYAEEVIQADDADRFDAAFMTGTSKEVLPIAVISDSGIKLIGRVNYTYNVDNEILRRIQTSYHELASDRDGN